MPDTGEAFSAFASFAASADEEDGEQTEEAEKGQTAKGTADGFGDDGRGRSVV